MKHKILFSVAVAVAIGINASSSFAQDTRVELIDRISAAQGVTDMFEQQIAQQQKSLQGYGAKLINDAASSKAAMAVFSEWMANEAQIRTTSLVTELLKELQQIKR